MLGTHRMEVDLPGRKLVWEAELSFTSDTRPVPACITSRLSENAHADPREIVARRDSARFPVVALYTKRV